MPKVVARSRVFALKYTCLSFNVVNLLWYKKVLGISRDLRTLLLKGSAYYTQGSDYLQAMSRGEAVHDLMLPNLLYAFVYMGHQTCYVLDSSPNHSCDASGFEDVDDYNDEVPISSKVGKSSKKSISTKVTL